MPRPVWAEVDLDAIHENAARLADLAAPAALCAVVKAYGYGHGPVRVAEAALAGGARCLAVALVEEGAALRRAGVTEPVLVLSEPPPDTWAHVVAHGLTAAVYTQRGVEAAAKAVAEAGSDPLPVHLKVDTGMHRVGCDPSSAVELARAITTRAELRFEGLWTHLAVADEPGNDYTARQLERFEAVRQAVAAGGMRPEVCHAANSAGTIAVPAARYDLVRCGIAVYGLAPSHELEGWVPLRPALSLRARVSYVKRVAVGERVSYGLRYAFERESTVATVPIGYADGVPRRLSSAGGEVLVGGRRRRIAGAVTMDQLMVDCGDDEIEVGDEVVLLGRQGDEYIGAGEWARLLGTISYEVVCQIGARVPRTFLPVNR
jgi:alanine racemase